MASQKIQFIKSLVQKMTELDAQKQVRNELYSMYFARGYNSGGADPIVYDDYKDNDEVGHIPLADLTACVTLIEQEDRFYSNQSVTQGDYNTTINKVRSIPT